mgnify:CR=1 FL=1
MSPSEIELMRVAGKLAADVLIMIEPYIKEGVTTGELDDICMDYITNEQKAISACLGYHGYPKCTCISVNEVVCHGIPGHYKLTSMLPLLKTSIMVTPQRCSSWAAKQLRLTTV